jgi:hypothetical protein
VRMFSPGRFLIHLSKVTCGRAAFGHFDPQDLGAASASHFRPARSLGRHIA